MWSKSCPASPGSGSVRSASEKRDQVFHSNSMAPSMLVRWTMCQAAVADARGRISYVIMWKWSPPALLVSNRSWLSV